MTITFLPPMSLFVFSEFPLKFSLNHKTLLFTFSYWFFKHIAETKHQKASYSFFSGK